MASFLKTFFTKFPWYLLLWPVFYAYNMNNDTGGALPNRIIWIQIGYWEMLLLSCYIFFRIFLSKPAYATIITVWLGLIYFYAYPISGLLKSIPVLRPVGSLGTMVVFWLLISVVMIVYFKKKKAVPSKWLQWIMVVMVTLTLYEVGHYFLLKFKGQRIDFEQTYRPKLQGILPVGKVPFKQLPDIYYLVFDGYSNTQCFKKYFHYDNSGLDSFLHKKGFYIAGKASSNYQDSPVSLAAVFNMNYPPGADHPKNVNDFTLLYGLKNISNNHLWNFLDRMGYRIINLGIFPDDDHPQIIRTTYFNAFSRILLQKRTLQTAIRYMIMKYYQERYPNKDPVLEYWINANYVNAEEIERRVITEAHTITDTPRFIYSHCMISHPPYIFDSSGNISKSITGRKDDPSGYIAGVKYATTLLQNWVAQITGNSKRPTIIILQADHGYRYFYDERDPKTYFEILNAFYFPDGDYHMLYDSISSVNTFRVVLNKYFGAQLPLLKDTSYIFLP